MERAGTGTGMAVHCDEDRMAPRRRSDRRREGEDTPMAKQGQHHNDRNDPNIARSRNNPKKSVVITTGTYKKQETYKKQAALHQDPGKKPPPTKPLWHPDPRQLLPHEAKSAERALEGTTRTGSDSNRDSGTRGY